MNILRFIILSCCFTLLSIAVYSQSTKNAGWIFISHTQQVTPKLQVLADAQVRSGEGLKHFETLLLRAGLGYKLNKQHTVAVGYTYKGDRTYEDGKSMYSPEQRVYEQYLFTAEIKRTELTFRLRQEQRFVKDTSRYNFSQRSRVFVSVQIPLIANADFSRGLYTTIQNELFINVQHKDKVNNHFLDQNRPLISIGYRWSKMIDIEIGYMYWLQRETEGDTHTNVYQLMITTSL